MNSGVFIFLAVAYMYVGRRIGWALSRNTLYGASTGAAAPLCVGWGVAVALCIHALAALLDPNIIVEVIFGFLLGAYVAMPNYGLFAEPSIPAGATERHAMIGTLPVFAYVLTLLVLAWLPVFGLLLSLGFLGVAGVIFIVSVSNSRGPGSPPPPPRQPTPTPDAPAPSPRPERTPKVTTCIRTIESDLLKRSLSDSEENNVAELCSGLLSRAMGDEKIVVRLVKLEWTESTDVVDAFRRAQDRWQKDHNRFV